MSIGGSSSNGMKQFLINLRQLPQNLKASVVRHGKPTSDRARSQTIFGNFFLHIHSVRVHLHSLRFSTTMALGIISLTLFWVLCVTGVLLMVYYKPSTAEAYDSILDIMYIVPTGRVMRNAHRWAAHGMVFMVILHMARVFYTASYRKPREANWLIGLALLAVTMALSFSGYLLPWDQLAFWAITIGTNIAQSPRELTDALGMTQYFDIGGITKELLLGATFVGQEALIRFYVLHVIVLPLALTGLLGVHFWRIRKDGGLAKPPDGSETPQGTVPEKAPSKSYGLMALVKGQAPATDQEPANTISSWPHMMYVYGALMMLTTAALLILGYFFDAPLKEIANPTVPENPAKAPWYFLALQEMVSYTAFAGGIAIPAIVVFGLALVPYLDRQEEPPGEWFSGKEGKNVALRSVIFCAVCVVATLTFTVKYGWLRTWFPTIPQIIITIVNPGTVLVLLFALWSLYNLRRANSTRMGAIALFTCFLVGFTLLTYFATYHRGPNWDFYWWGWPEH